MPRDERTKADYQPWNHEHFMADRYVRRMHPHIRKSYVMLLHEAFFCSTRPYLPDEDNELWLLADCESLEEWLKQSESVREMFDSIEIEGVKLLTQKRVEDDWDRILGKRGVVSGRARNAALTKWESVSERNSKTRSQRLSEARKIGTHTKEEWRTLLEICLNVCVRCGNDVDICKDHIKPIYQGGSDHISNLQPLCKTCNSSKGPESEDFRPVDWEERLRNACGTPAQTEMPAKLREEKRSKAELSEVEESPKTENLEDGQEEDMKAEKAIPVSCMEILRERAETYSDVIEQIKSRARATSNGQVLREFEEWAVENQGDDFRGKPLSAWLRSYTSGRIEQKQATENPMVKAIGREIAYRSGNQMVLEPKHKSALVPIIEEDSYSFEEVLGAYSEFFQKMDKNNPKNIQYAANNFVAQAADLLYSVRRKATEKQAEQAAVAATAERMQIEAEQDRQKRLEAREREQELVEEELPD